MQSVVSLPNKHLIILFKKCYNPQHSAKKQMDVLRLSIFYCFLSLVSDLAVCHELNLACKGAKKKKCVDSGQ